MMFHINCPDVMLTGKCNLRCKYCFEHKYNGNMDVEKFRKYVEEGCFTAFFPFGGEPLLRLELLEKILETADEHKKKLIKENLITNGVLIPKYIEKIKELGLHMQISVDGPRHVNDINRKYANGRGTFDDIIKGISACIKHKVPWSIHGVCTKETLPYLAESLFWFFKIYRLQSKEEATKHLRQNTIQVIFEEDWDDKDVDIIIEQFYKFTEMIMKLPDFTYKEKITTLSSLFNRIGASCGAGTSLLAIDENFDIYPCHRLATVPERENYKLGNVYKPKEFKNYKQYNSYSRLKEEEKMYSSITDLQKGFKIPWFMWCPATNIQTSNTVYYQNAKYNIMFTELSRAIEELKRKYNISDGNPRQRNNCQ